jgi:LytS/YehU family sensor histidine kinase
VAYVARRFPFRRQDWVRNAALHCLFIIPFSFLHTSIMASIRTAVFWLKDTPYRFGGDNLARQVLYEFYKDISLYWTLVAVALAFDYYRRYRDRELETEQLQRQLVEAELQNLRGQLHPHFLFNTLNMISSRMYEDVGEADRMIARLGDLLRFALKSSDEPEVPLRTELEMLDLYLEIMRARFADSVSVDVNIDRETQRVMVPTLLLQPLVENAFRHGIASRPGGGRIEISGHVKNGSVRLIVADNGPGIRGSLESARVKGVGLSNTARRLEQLYGQGHSFELRNRLEAEGGGLEVAIEIPSGSGR